MYIYIYIRVVAHVATSSRVATVAFAAEVSSCGEERAVESRFGPKRGFGETPGELLDHR